MIKSVTRGKVHVETKGRHRSLTALERDPVIILNPSLEGSWFNLPKPVAPDTIGYWPRHTKFPGYSEYTHVPYDERKLTPIKFLYYVEDELLESFLSPAKGTDRSGYIWLNSEVFASASFHVPTLTCVLRWTRVLELSSRITWSQTSLLILLIN